MKLKNINFFQQHIEKIVLGAAGLFLLVTTVLFVLLGPFAIEIPGEPGKVSPGEVEEVVWKHTERLQGKLAEEPDTDNWPRVPDISSRFGEMIQQEVLPYSRLAGVYGQPMHPDDITPIGGPDQPYYVPHPQLPQDLAVHAGHAVLADATQVQDRRHEQVIELVGVNEKPYDFAYASATARFNIDQWRRLLRADPPDAGQRKLDQVLATNRVGVAGVYLQRQERDPVTGEWGNTTIVRPLPTQIGFTAEQAVPWEGEQARGAMQWIRDNQPIIQRPDFVALDKGRWIPPHQAPPARGPDQERRLNGIIEDIQKLQDRLETWEQLYDRRPSDALRSRIDRAESDLRQLEQERDELIGLPTEPRDQRPRDEFEQYQEPGRDDFRRNRRPDNRRNRDPAFEELPPEAFEDPTQREVRRSARLAQARTNDRRAPNVLPWESDRQDEADDGAGQAGDQADEIVRVWAHDLTVERGKTYRYRVIVSVLNPLFQHRRGVPESQQREYYDRIALGPDERTLASAEWSEPVRIDPEYYFFLVGGNTNNDQAEVEIWRIYDGQWRRGTFRLRPGDPITGLATIQTGAGEVELDLTADALFIDLMNVSGGGYGRTDTRMLYFDQARNQLADRTVEQDSEHPSRLRLQNELMLQESELMQARLDDADFGRP